MIHIYTGSGKGKTTAAYGLALRARGWKKRVCVIQFLKSKDFVYGEALAAKSIGIKVVCLNQKHPLFCADLKETEYNSKLRILIQKGLKKIKGILKSKRYDVVVLDEIINCLDQKYIRLAEIMNIINSSPKGAELILTGRGSLPRKLLAIADYVTNLQEIKHPFRKSVRARRGIEF